MRITIEIEAARARRVLRVVTVAVVAGALAYGVAASAAPVGSLVTFSAGQPIRAADFNANFQALKTASDDNDARIGNLSGLATNAKTTLVAAVNEVFAKAGTGTAGPQGATGATGPQGPAGPTTYLLAGRTTITGSGGGTNAWTTGTFLAGTATPILPASLILGKPFTATFQIQTSDATTGAFGAPLAGGNLVLDLVWTFNGGRVGTTTTSEFPTVTQAAVASVVITPGVANSKTVTFTGNAPAVAPNTANGFPATSFGALQGAGVHVQVNAATTAQGQGIGTLSVTITP